jgi:hypothetical protein
LQNRFALSGRAFRRSSLRRVSCTKKRHDASSWENSSTSIPALS